MTLWWTRSSAPRAHAASMRSTPSSPRTTATERWSSLTPKRCATVAALVFYVTVARIAPALRNNAERSAACALTIPVDTGAGAGRRGREHFGIPATVGGYSDSSSDRDGVVIDGSSR